jgi:transcriptional regulator with XRE-family HTH domain
MIPIGIIVHTQTKQLPPLPVRRALRDLGSHLQVWRKLRGLTQGQLAERAGVTRRTIGRMERGDGEVRTEILLRIAHALGVLDRLARVLDPYETDMGRLRADEQLPKRIRPRRLD